MNRPPPQLPIAVRPSSIRRKVAPRKLAAMKTTVTELPESKVKIDVAVEPELVAKRVDRAAKAFATR